MSIQEKFEKAVNVIRNLPKNGSYQPSHELQLRFYAYYKQATEGTNHHPRPSFWEVVKRAKWDAWAKLGNMTQQEAMAHYVEELRKIVETMSYTDNVANFLNSLDNFYEHVPAEDLEMLVGPIIEKIRSRPNSPLSGSPLASRDTSPSRTTVQSRDASPLRLSASAAAHGSAKHITSSLETSPASSYSASPLPPDTDDEEDEHFLDTQTEPDRGKEGGAKKTRSEGALPGEPIVKKEKELLRPIASAHPGSRGSENGTNSDITLHVPAFAPDTISVLRSSLEEVKSRLHSVENTVSDQEKQLNCITSSHENENKSSSPGPSAAVSEAFRRAIDSMTKDMETLQRRMSMLENRRQQEMSVSRKRSGAVMARWWGLPVQTTAALLVWPILILLLSKWWSNRRRR